MRYLILMAVILSGCAHVNVMEADQDSVRLCGNRVAQQSDFMEAAQKACGTERVEQTKYYRDEYVGGASTNSLTGATTVKYGVRNCYVYKCDRTPASKVN